MGSALAVLPNGEMVGLVLLLLFGAQQWLSQLHLKEEVHSVTGQAHPFPPCL